MPSRISPHASLLKLPHIIRSMEKNHSIAEARFKKLAHTLLVFVEGGGPGGGAPTDNYGEQVLQEEVDAAVDELQDLLDKQQQALEGLGDGSSSGAGHDSGEAPCSQLLDLYQAALKVNDAKDAQKYLTEYATCVRNQAGGTPNRPKKSG